ncbi:MAG TPA: hypothetical protein VJ735_17730 [Actinomycetes bacterium]|nr:hypothetical protein [Actinomycetes bacterium]
MRRLLVIAIVIGSILFLQAPAQAVHLYLKMTPNGDGTTSVQTNCPKGSTLKVTVGATSKSITVPKNGGFDSRSLNTVAAKGRSAGYKKVSATCSPASQGHKKLRVLPFTGVTTSQQLAVGLGLLGLGAVLLRLGFSPSPRRRPRRRRPPVKVWAQ